MSTMTRTAYGLDTRGEHWSQRGACRDRDPQLWTDPKCAGDGQVICRRLCPVRVQCLAYGLELPRRERREVVYGGVWFNDLGHPTAQRRHRRST